MDYYLSTSPKLSGLQQKDYERFLQQCGLRDENDTDFTALIISDEEEILACGSLRGNILKQIAVSPSAEGLGLCAEIVTALVSEAAARGDTHLFLYTKPAHRAMFAGLGFTPLVQTSDILMMENRPNGIANYLSSLPQLSGKVGAIVCNCNPFTLGHRYLIEYASQHCDELYVFVLSEDRSFFPADIRFQLVKEGTAHLPNVHVVPSSSYLISRATFPTYFIKDTARCADAACELDITLFGQVIAPKLGITVRFVGQEPFDPVTRGYNELMKKQLPAMGIELVEIERFENISASRVRRCLQEKKLDELQSLLPEVTYEYCRSHFS
ncbi:MAG: [citrate (pro-3S)-lyase] ligase [Oscillospiraceae bacterium]|nr:[citrate (pro-3S)-lyase] ligase [Oscillospiraceae bacterium]